MRKALCGKIKSQKHAEYEFTVLCIMQIVSDTCAGRGRNKIELIKQDEHNKMKQIVSDRLKIKVVSGSI